jgi:cyanate permease
MTSAFGLGQIIGPSFAGSLFDQLGSFALPSAVAAAALVVAALLGAR